MRPIDRKESAWQGLERRASAEPCPPSSLVEVATLVGRPKAEVQALARTFTERAIKTLGEITEDVKAPPAARALGANALLDCAWGRDRSSLSCRLVTGVRQAQLWRRTSARFSPEARWSVQLTRSFAGGSGFWSAMGS